MAVFFSVGSAGACGLAEYNGSTWLLPFGSIIDYQIGPHDVEEPGPDVIYSSTIYNGNLIIGGYFNSIGGVTINGITQWNGSSWSAL